MKIKINQKLHQKWGTNTLSDMNWYVYPHSKNKIYKHNNHEMKTNNDKLDEYMKQ